MGQDNSCHPYITSHNCDADSAYGSTYGSNCCEADIKLYHLTTSEESDVDKSYDADDEVEGLTNDGNVGNGDTLCVYRKRPDRPTARSRPDSGMFFCLSKNDHGGQSGAPEYSYLMDIIKERAKLSERLYHTIEDDGKRRLYSVEYDVIGTEDDDSGHEDRSNKPAIKPIITFRNHQDEGGNTFAEGDGGLVEIIASYKRRRLCKVKSLPDLRIPLRKKSTRCKTSTYSESIDRYKTNTTNRTNNNNTYSYKLSPLCSYRIVADSERFCSVRGRSSSVKSLHQDVVERKTLPTSKCVDFKMVSDQRLGNFKICHMIETLEK